MGQTLEVSKNKQCVFRSLAAKGGELIGAAQVLYEARADRRGGSDCALELCVQSFWRPSVEAQLTKGACSDPIMMWAWKVAPALVRFSLHAFASPLTDV